MNQGTSGSGARRWLTLGALTALLLALLAGAAFGVTGSGGVGKTQPKLLPGTQYPAIDEESEEELFAQDRAFVAGRTAGDNPLDIAKAGQLRAKAAHDAKSVGKTAPPSGPASFSGAWSQTGPQPTFQIQRSDFAPTAVSGRIGALAVRPSTGQLILGAAQGGIWRYDNGAWTPRTTTRRPRRSALSPSRPPTTRSSTPARARARCPATPTSATASCAPTTAAGPGRRSPATTSRASRCRGSWSTRATSRICTRRSCAAAEARAV